MKGKSDRLQASSSVGKHNRLDQIKSGRGTRCKGGLVRHRITVKWISSLQAYRCQTKDAHCLPHQSRGIFATRLNHISSFVHWLFDVYRSKKVGHRYQHGFSGKMTAGAYPAPITERRLCRVRRVWVELTVNCEVSSGIKDVRVWVRLLIM